jgi:hypothetical protein
MPRVIDEHLDNCLVAGIRAGRESGQEDLLLDAKVPGAVVRPEREHVVSDLAEVVLSGPVHAHRAVESLMVIARQIAERGMALHSPLSVVERLLAAATDRQDTRDVEGREDPQGPPRSCVDDERVADFVLDQKLAGTIERLVDGDGR